MDRGICTNQPSRCSKAASRELIPMPSPYVTCPECGRRPERVKPGFGPAPASRGGGGFKVPRPVLIGGAAVIVLLLAFLAWRSFGGSGSEGQSGPAVASGDYILRLSGSNTVGKALAPELAKAWLESKGATDIVAEQRKVEGKDAAETVIKASLDGRTVAIEVRPHGSSTAFVDLLASTADIGMASRAIKSKEVEDLAKLGDMRSESSEHVVGLDGVAVIVNPANPIGALSTAQLRRIFTGQITDWREIGGQPGPIKLYARDDKSGTFDTFKELVLRGDALGKAERFEDSGKLEAAVADDEAGIGFVGLPSVKTTKALAVNDGEGAPLEPTSFSIRTESYPLSRRLYFYAAPDTTKREVKEFVAFALSASGQAVVRKNQFVDLDLVTASATPVRAGSGACELSAEWRGDRNAYCALKQGSEPLPTTFRFRSGSDVLDNRAIADVRRVLARMEQSPNKQIVLAGFSDNVGAYASNCAISQARAKRVADALATLGLSVAEVVGFCSELPVRDNGTPEGRDQNRRVEIFLR